MPLIGKSQYNSAFSPTSIPDCVLWLDATDSNAMTLSGSNVTTWRDKSGRSYNFTKNASYPAPVYQSNGINGRPALSFSNDGNLGTSNTRFLENADVSFNNTSYSIFAVANLTAENSWTNAQYILKGEITGDSYLFFGSRAKNIATFTGTSSGWNDTNSNSPTTTIFNTPRIVGMTVSNTVLTPYYDGIAMSNKTGTTGAFRGLRLGEAAPLGNSGQGWTGFIGEVLVYSFALQPAQRQTVEGYLAAKWGLLSNLPATQPLKTIRPFARPFIPTDISGCALWLDAMDPSGTGVRPATGLALASWVDKSGAGNNALQTNASYRPTFAIDSDSPAISFVSANTQHMLGGPLLTSTQYSIFCVSRSRVSNALQFVFWNYKKGTGGTGQNYIQHVIGDTGIAGADFLYAESPQTVKTLASGPTVSTNRFIQSMVDSPTNTTQNFFVNGTSYSTTFTNGGVANIATDATGYGLGCIRAPGAVLSLTLNGFIYEVIAYLAEVSSGQRQQIETYLANKWGLRGSTPSNHYARLSPALSSVFNPLLLGNCSLWLDAADSSVITLSGSNVTAWNDKSGNGRNAVVSSNAYATLTGTPQGLLFSNSFYTTTFSADPSVETGFVVYNMSSNGILVGAYNAGREIAFQSLTLVGPLKAEVAWGPLATSAGNVRQMVTTFTSSTATSAAVNGGTAVTGSGLTFTSGNVTTLGREVGSNFPYGGYVYEIILFNANLTTPQRQITEGYLAWKWGFTSSLPSNHPYRTVKP
jgi:hypothetical protein